MKKTSSLISTKSNKLRFVRICQMLKQLDEFNYDMVDAVLAYHINNPVEAKLQNSTII